MAQRQWQNTFWVGIYRCQMSYTKRRGIWTEWDPDLPNRPLTIHEMAQYRAGRDTLMVEIAKDMGVPASSIVVVET